MVDKDELVELLRQWGVSHAEEWAEQELRDEHFAVLAMFRFLRPLQHMLDGYLYGSEYWVQQTIERKDPTAEVLKEMIDAGIAPEKIGWFAYWIAREAINAVLYRLDDPAGGDYDLPNEGEGLPSWSLQERIEHREGTKWTAELTGRVIGGMHTLFPFHNPEDKKME
ncbi:hypothetical protein [Polycladomyces zharkentensis]|nr:hypothetical protein [Polycladomyces sp. WAk]